MDEIMTFGEALVELKAGHKVCRRGWNGKGMFLYLVPGHTFEKKDARQPIPAHMPDRASYTYRPHIDMCDAQGYLVPWLASQTDLLAEDWQIVY